MTARPGRGGSESPLRLAFLVVTTMLCGALVMVIEIRGSKAVGPFFGVSLFVRTSLITVTLGRCGRRLYVRYWGKAGTAARYLCTGDFAADGGRYCLGFWGATVGRRFGEEVVRVLFPLGMRASLQALARPGRAADRRIARAKAVSASRTRVPRTSWCGTSTDRRFSA